MNIKKLFNLFFLFVFFSTAVYGDYSILSMTCENKENPTAVDTPYPLLGWTLKSDVRNNYQTAYEIIVSDQLRLVEANKGNVWKSGKVKSSECNNIQFKGKQQSLKRYFWRVRSYDKNGEASPWSSIAYWDVALLSPDEWKAQWISDGSKTPDREEDFYLDSPAPLFRKDIHLQKEVADAKLLISGLGYLEAYINGKLINDHFMDPGWTSYDKRILYTMTDVTELLRKGDNTIGVILGNGFYNPLPMRIFQPLRNFLTVGRPSLIAQLHIRYQDGSSQLVPTDLSWKTIPGPIIRNNVYLGECYDARKEVEGWSLPGIDISSWNSVTVMPISVNGLKLQTHPPVKETARLKANRMTEVRPGEFVFDLGQNFAGVARVTVRGKRGSKIVIRYGEDVYSDASLNVMTSVAGQLKTIWNADWTKKGQPQTAWQEDVYTKKSDDEEIWNPRFTFHGFRYIELTGTMDRPILSDVEGLRLSADLKTNGTFSCSNELINRLERNIEWTFLSNVFSVQSDCPGREKLGYGGDIVGTVDAFCYKFDMHHFYAKSVEDYKHASRPSGAMTETAPYMGIADLGFGDGSGPIGWQLAFGLMQKKLYDYYGDKRIIENNYDTFKKQVEFLRLQAKDHIIDHCISDHETLDKRPEALTATAHYYHHVVLLAEFAGLLNKKYDKEEYDQLSLNIKNSFIKYFYRASGEYDIFTQTTQSFALFYDLIPEGKRERVFDKLLETIKLADGHVRSGIFGIPAMLNTLLRYDRNDVAYDMVTKPDFPGWGYMINHGATTLWETWAYSDNVYSQNHPMFGGVNEWFYRGLLGINNLSSGFKEIEIKPQPVSDLSWAKGSYQSIIGLISVEWKQEKESFSMDVNIPVGVKALIKIPNTLGGILYDGQTKVSQLPEMQLIGKENYYDVVKVGSGFYQFQIR